MKKMRFWKRRETAPEGEVEPLADITSTDVTAADRFCRGDASSFPVGNGAHLIYPAYDDTPRIIPAELAQLLKRCRGLKTLDEHSATYARFSEPDGGGGDAVVVGPLKERLNKLVEAGLLISESELLERCRRAAERAEPPPPITTVGVVTRDRLESLQRCLRSYMENLNAYGRTSGFVVMDDSERPESREQTREMLRQLKRRYGLEVAYAGEEEKLRFAEALIAGGDLPPETVRFALFAAEWCGYKAGANHNALLLHTAGEMMFSADDDAVCRLALIPEEDAPVRAGAHEEPKQFWFYSDRDAALKSARFVNEDILAVHEQFLGKDVASCIAAHGNVGILNFDGPDSFPHWALLPGAGKVVAAFAGTVGDAGLSIPVWYSQKLDACSQARLTQSEVGYRSARTSREILRGVARPRITRGVGVNFTTKAFDNRSLLPPFIPVGRGDDWLFAYTWQTCFKDCYFADLPRAVVHDPMEARAFSPEQIEETASSVITMAQVIKACILSLKFPPRIGDGADKLRALGGHLAEIASLPPPDFEEFVGAHVGQMQSRYIASMEKYLRGYGGAPEFWANDLERYLNTMRGAVARREFIVPLELMKSRDVGEALSLMQRVILMFGELLQAWPEMIEKAKELRAKGRRVAIDI